MEIKNIEKDYEYCKRCGITIPFKTKKKGICDTCGYPLFWMTIYERWILKGKVI